MELIAGSPFITVCIRAPIRTANLKWLARRSRSQSVKPYRRSLTDDVVHAGAAGRERQEHDGIFGGIHAVVDFSFARRNQA